ncbi:MAG: hypothetical protein LBM69_03155, partial [Lachnospiraceae bacterium]|nr:hypothetical protein [Lachnospiraceae bacterium]
SIDFQNGSCILEGEKGLSFQIDGKELISLTSSGVEIKADQITVDASNSLTLKGGTAKIEANTLSMEAKSECKVKANASLKLESSGIAALKGSMTQIN